jgi:regulator of sigma E protease
MITDYLFAVIVLLSVLIFVHELGHFLVAKACGVRVLKFSLGFGSPIGFGRWRARWVRGNTEYVLAWFPLGGFVKMLGENPDEEQGPEATASPEETLGAKPLWQKLAIVFAGPVMNLALPILLFVVMQWVGLPRADTEVGLVEAGSPAETVGLRPGDRILEIDGQAVHWWADVFERLSESAGREVALRYEREGRDASVVLPVHARAGLDPFGEPVERGWAGLVHPRPSALIGVQGRDSPARASGLRSGDLVRSVGGEPVADWYALGEAYAAVERGGAVALVVARSQGEEIEIEVPALVSLEALGVVPASAPITAVQPDSPADRAGLRPGDLVVEFDGWPITYFDSFAQAVSASGGRTVPLAFLRDGEIHRIEIAAEPIASEMDVGAPRHRLGIVGSNALVRGAVGIDRQRNPLVAFPRAVDMTVDITRVFLVGLSKLVTGEVSSRNLAGPIGIAQMAGDALRQGWEDYLRLMVLISINLGILNLLPIPILDGGQATLFLVESIKRSPLSLRTKVAAQQMGLTVLVLLMGLAFWNDLSRLWSRMIDWLPPGP